MYRTWRHKEMKGKHVKFRHISAVKNKDLKIIHQLIDEKFRLPVASSVFSYRSGESSASCATRHVGCFALFKLDIKDFFPSITRSMIEFMYRGYLEQLSSYGTYLTPYRIKDLARMISIVCTRSDTRKVNVTETVLPIGIVPASSISNYVLYDYDRGMEAVAKKYKLIYSRYSDNVFISARKKHIPREIQLLAKRRINEFTMDGETHPFRCNDFKERYSPIWRHQRVLGAVVNEKMNISRRRESWLRSALNHAFHDLEKLLQDIEEGKITRAPATKRLQELIAKSRTVHGDMSYTKLVAPGKYRKYLSKHQAVRMMLDETKTMVEDM